MGMTRALLDVPIASPLRSGRCKVTQSAGVRGGPATAITVPEASVGQTPTEVQRVMAD
jgi:hypothetical protein